MMNRYAMFGRVGLMLAVGSALVAQETGQVHGVVKTTAGKSVAGAVVKIESPQLLKFRTFVTAEDGQFRFPLLPPGDYKMTATAPEYISTGATFRIGIGTRIVQEMVMKPIATAGTTVEVVGTVNAAVDKADTKTATNFSSQVLESLPASDRAFFGAAQLAPGVVTTSTGSVSIRGGKTATTVYTLNGGSVGDEYQGQQYENRVVDDAIEDVQVIQSPLNARYGRTGSGIMNIVSKSGGNEFKGSIRKQIGRTDWGAWAPNARNSRGYNNAYSSRVTDVFMEGPIIKDRLWFSTFTKLRPAESFSDNILAGENPANWSAGYYLSPGDLAGVFGVPEVPHTYSMGKTLSGTYKSDTFSFKLTLGITQDHTISLERYIQNAETANRNPYGIPIVATVGSNSLSQKDDSSTSGLQYRGTFGTSIFVEAMYNKMKSGAVFPAPSGAHVRWNNGGSAYGVLFPYGFNLSPARDGRDSQNGSINVKIFADIAGSHEIDAGVDWYQFERGTMSQNGALNRRFYVPWVTPGSAAAGHLPSTPGFGSLGADPYGETLGFFTENLQDDAALYGGNPGVNGTAAVYQQYYGKDGLTTNRNIAIYLNDQWAINNNWSVMVGLRMDKFRVTDTDGAVLLDKMAPVSPRMSVKYDLQGDSRRVISFTAAKFVESYGAGFTDAFVKKANTRWARFGWSAFNPGDYGFVGYNALTNPQNYGGPKGLGATAGAPYQIFDAASGNIGINDITNPYSLEFTVGYKRSYENGAYLSLNLVNREWKNDFAIVQDLNSSYVKIAGDPSGLSTSTIPLLATRYGNSDLLERKYWALEMDFASKVGTFISVGGSYTFSRLTGNQEGGDSTAQGFRDNGASAPLFYRDWLTSARTGATALTGGPWSVNDFAPYGPLSSDQTHKLRLTLSARLPLGKGWISYSLLARYDSGSAYSAVRAADPESGKWLASLPSGPKPTAATTFNRFYSGRGAYRFADTYGADFKVAFEVPVFWRVRLMGDVQVTNVFNSPILSLWNTAFAAKAAVAERAYPIKLASPGTFGTDNETYTNYVGRRTITASMGLRF